MQSLFNFETIAVFNTVFFSIILQAFPFLLLGTFVSSLLHIFVSDDVIVNIFPLRWGVGFFTALFAGLLFPVCECATVPVMQRLIKKGVAMPIAVTFMLAAPIINPISIIATVYAFPQYSIIAFYRVFFGLLTALIIGIVLLFYPKANILKINNAETNNKIIEHTCSCTHCSEKHQHTTKFVNVIMHMKDEFFSVGKFLIIGAAFASFIRISMIEDFLSFQTSDVTLEIAVQMLFAFMFSACSTSDAFIARSFFGNFSLSSIMGFLVYGPMMDIKNLFMLLSFLKKQFVIELTVIITILNLIMISTLTKFFL